MDKASKRAATIRSAPAVATLLLAACATVGGHGNYYAQFYEPQAGITPEEIAAGRAAPPTGTPRVIHRDHYDENALQDYARQGYVLIGVSSFTSGYTESENDAVQQAIKVGADLVEIWTPRDAGSMTASVPITTPTSTTSQTRGTASAFGSTGSAIAFGSSTTTTQGANTTYVPMTVQRTAYAAGYFVKRKYHFGANFRDLTDSERQRLQTNHGAYVVTVVDGSPAYESDILPGDIIVRLGGQVANGAGGLTELIKANFGRSVEVGIVRAGGSITKHVAILP